MVPDEPCDAQPPLPGRTRAAEEREADVVRPRQEHDATANFPHETSETTDDGVRFGDLPLEQLRGVGSFDVDEFWLLASASVDRVAESFVRVRNAPIWQQDVFGHEVELRDPSFGAFRLRGHAWTLIRSLRCSDPFQWLRSEDAQQISAHIGGRAILYFVSDTAVAVGYELYDSGELVELFQDCPDCYDDELTGPPNSPLETVSLINSATESGPKFVSRLRTVSSAALRSPYPFVDAFFRSQDAFVPFWAQAFFAERFFQAEPRFQVGIAGLESHDVERFDIISL